MIIFETPAASGRPASMRGARTRLPLPISFSISFRAGGCGPASCIAEILEASGCPSPGDDRGIATLYHSIGEVDPNATIATEIPRKITRDGGRATKERSAIVDARIILLVKQVVDERPIL